MKLIQKFDSILDENRHKDTRIPSAHAALSTVEQRVTEPNDEIATSDKRWNISSTTSFIPLQHRRSVLSFIDSIWRISLFHYFSIRSSSISDFLGERKGWWGGAARDRGGFGVFFRILLYGDGIGKCASILLIWF